MVRYLLTAHAQAVIEAREISLAWVERVLTKPERTEPDRVDLELQHALGRIGDYDDRVLRVVYNRNSDPWRIITVYFDRTMRGKL